MQLPRGPVLGPSERLGGRVVMTEPANPWLITLMAWVGGLFLAMLVVGLGVWWLADWWRERRDARKTVDGARGELVTLL